MRTTLAIDIGGTKFSLAAFVDGRMERRATRPTDRAGGAQAILAEICALGHDWQHELAFQRCGVGFGGPVDFGRQRVLVSNHVAGWLDYPLVPTLQAELGVPVVIDNDANLGALGEALYGAGQGCDPLLYVTLSTGIGGGIVAGGQVLRGADSYGGEIGHVTIRPGGPQCLCGGYGCFERLCSGLWLERDYGQPAHVLLQDPAFVARYVVDLALGLRAAIMLLNPARIVIGGGIAKAGDALFVPLRAELRRTITPWSRARIDVQPAALGDDSVLWGALALAEQS